MILKIFYGAIKGAVVATVIPLVLIAIVTSIWAIVTKGLIGLAYGPLTALYFAGVMIIFVGPFGFILGAIWSFPRNSYPNNQPSRKS